MTALDVRQSRTRRRWLYATLATCGLAAPLWLIWEIARPRG